MQRLKFIIHDEGHHQGKVARKAKISQPTLSGIIHGRLIPTPRELAALAAVLHVSPPERLMDEVRVVGEAEVRVVAEAVSS